MGFWAGRGGGRNSKWEAVGLESVLKVLVEKVWGPTDLGRLGVNCQWQQTPVPLLSLPVCTAAWGSWAESRGVSGCFGSSALMLSLSVFPSRREAQRDVNVDDVPPDCLGH